MLIELIANYIKINLIRDDEKTKLIRQYLIIDDDNDKEFFTIWVNCANDDDFVI